MTEKKTYIFNGKTAVFDLENNPKFLTVINIIKSAADAIVSDVVEYAPYLTSYMIDYSLISYLTDIKLPKDLNECYDFIYMTEITEIIKQTNPDLYDFVTENVKSLVEYRKEQMLKKSKIDELIDSLTNLVTVFTNEFDGVDIKEVIEKMEKIGINKDMNEKDVVSSILRYRDNQSQDSNIININDTITFNLE